MLCYFSVSLQVSRSIGNPGQVDLSQANSCGCGEMARELGGEWPMSPVAGMTQVCSGRTW